MVQSICDIESRERIYMTDAAAPTYDQLLSLINALYASGATASPEQASAIKAAVDKLMSPDRGSTMDFSDPANAVLS